MKEALHFSEMLHLLSEAYRTGMQVDVWAWKSNGQANHYAGWLVHGDYWRGGWVRLRNPVNGEIRLVPEIFIYRFNGHNIYL